MESSELNPPHDSVVDGGFALCAMLTLSLSAAMLSGFVTTFCITVFGWPESNPLITTVIITWVGGWIGLMLGCGLVWAKNQSKTTETPALYSLRQRCDSSVARFRVESTLPVTREWQEDDWRGIAIHLLETMEENSAALEAIGINPEATLSQPFLDRLVEDVVSSVQRFAFAGYGEWTEIVRGLAAANASRAALDAVQSPTSPKSSGNYARLLADAVLATKQRTIVDQLNRPILDQFFWETRGCNDAYRVLTAEQLEQNHAFTKLIRQLEHFAHAVDNVEAALPFRELKDAATQMILALSPDDEEESDIAVLPLRLELSPFIADERDRGEFSQRPPYTDAVDVFREASRFRLVDAIMPRTVTLNERPSYSLQQAATA